MPAKMALSRAPMARNRRGTSTLQSADKYKCSTMSFIHVMLFSCVVTISLQIYTHFMVVSPEYSSHPKPYMSKSEAHIRSSRERDSQKDDNSMANLQAFRDSSQKIKQEFYMRYGGEDFASKMLEKGIKRFGTKDIEHTTGRILFSIATNQPFVISFGGYSVTVGRGNYFRQSYPFVLESILIDAMTYLGVSGFSVRNAAIGGIPSFPYGWCLRNFLGDDVSAVSWDFGMNEGNSADGLESYLRHSMTMLEHVSSSKLPSPMFMILDTSRERQNLLKEYVNRGFIHDPIAIQWKNLGYESFTSGEQSEASIPVGFQNWTVWGAPDGSPGQSSWHPKYKEHELIGWLLSMHFLKAMDGAYEVIQASRDTWKMDILSKWWKDASGEAKLPPPVTGSSNHQLSSLMLGIPSSPDTVWKMNPTHCRTTFQQNENGNLLDNVVTGVAPLSITQDMMEFRGEAIYTSGEGWVWDIGEVERQTKQKLQRFGGLGYIDMKTALYGIPSSGTLSLFLPFDNADLTISTLVVCEVNEKRGNKECNLSKDVNFVFGGQTVTNAETITQTAAYLKKPICVRLPVPPNAATISTPPALQRKLGKRPGVLLEMSVTGSHVNVKDGACSVSHVIWEMK